MSSSATRTTAFKFSSALLVIGIGLVFLGYFVWQNFRYNQPITLTYQQNHALVDLQTFGRYYANVLGLRIVDKNTGSTVWEVKPKNVFFPVWTLDLKPGKNKGDLGLGNSVVITYPTQSGDFNLETGRHYELLVTSEMSGKTVHRSIDILFQPVPSP